MSKQHLSDISRRMIITPLLKVKHLQWRSLAISRSLMTHFVKFLGKCIEFLVNMFERRKDNKRDIKLYPLTYPSNSVLRKKTEPTIYKSQVS